MYNVSVVIMHNVSVVTMYNVSVVTMYNVSMVTMYNVSVVTMYNVSVVTMYNVSVVTMYNVSVVTMYNVSVVQLKIGVKWLILRTPPNSRKCWVVPNAHSVANQPLVRYQVGVCRLRQKREKQRKRRVHGTDNRLSQ